MRELDNGVVLRNIQEQVQYLTDFHQANQGIAEWGIHVVGQLTDPIELPPVDAYTGNWGDAYAVGNEAPYDFYIWTEDSTAAGVGYWFNFGPISIVGPQGPEGPAGKDGQTGKSTKWTTVLNNLPNPGVYNEGDFVLVASTGDVYRANVSSGAAKWNYVCNIKGPQGIQGVQGPEGPVGPEGPQGQKGDTGDVGGLVNMYGILSSANQLPPPSILNDVTAAFLVGTQSPYNLYIQVGATPEVSTWQNTGPFNIGTLVSVDGQYQNLWNADTKANAEIVENLTQYSIPFWKDGKFEPLGDLKTYYDGRQVYMGDDNADKMAFSDTIIYQQSKTPNNDPRKAAMSGRGGFTLSNYLENVNYGYTGITVTPTINNQFGTFDNDNAKKYTLPATPGQLVTANEVYSKEYIDALGTHPQIEGWKLIEHVDNKRYADGFLSVCRYQNLLEPSKMMAVIDYYDVDEETVTADPTSLYGYTIGKWQSKGLPIHNFLALMPGVSITNYKYITVNEYSWIVKPELNNNRQFLDAAIVTPKIYDAINTNGQATIFGLAIRFGSDNANYDFKISGKHMKITCQNYI